MVEAGSEYTSTRGERIIHIPDVIPIFPLASTVLLPGEVLPLHIFEERYRQMTRDAIASNRVIGICQVAPGFGEDLSGSPPIDPIGCAGFIGRHEQLDDGRFLIMLYGLERFDVTEELETGTLYRQARVSYGTTNETAEQHSRLEPLRHELRTLLPALVEHDEEVKKQLAEQLDVVEDAQLIAIASQLLSLPAARKRQLLRAADTSDRFLLVFENLYAHLEQHPELSTEFDEAILN